MAIKNVAIAGASGRLGPAVLASLIAASFNVTVLVRSSSKATYPSQARTVTVQNDFAVDALTEALKGQDALVITLAGTNTEVSLRLIDACIKAGVKRVIPADFGSGDSADPHAQKLVPGYGEKAKVRAYLEKLVSEHDGFSWTSLLGGHFFDWGIESGFFHVDLKGRTSDIFDDGEKKFSTSTLSRIGEGVVRVLQKEEATKNKMLYIQSFCINQYDILEALQRQAGQDWTVSFLKSDGYLKQQQALYEQGNQHAMEEIVFVHGITTSDWTKNPNFAMELLDLKDEDLDLVIRKVVEQVLVTGS